MNRMMLLAAALAAIPLAAFAQEQAQPLTPEQTVDARQSKMGQGRSAIAAMKQAAESDGDLAALGPRIDWLIHWSDELPTLFPEGSHVAGTDARPEVWSDRPGFQRAAARFQAAARALAAPAAAGDRPAFQAALAEARASCGGCHDAFKG
jgi:cytochrome c556